MAAGITPLHMPSQWLAFLRRYQGVQYEVKLFTEYGSHKPTDARFIIIFRGTHTMAVTAGSRWSCHGLPMACSRLPRQVPRVAVSYGTATAVPMARAVALAMAANGRMLG